MIEGASMRSAGESPFDPGRWLELCNPDLADQVPVAVSTA